MRTYAIKLEGSTQQKRQKLYDFLISKNEPIYQTTNLIKKHYDYKYFKYNDSDIWAGAGNDDGFTPISISDFITKFQESTLNIRDYCIDCTDSTHTERQQITAYLDSISEFVYSSTTFMDDDDSFQKGAIFGYDSSGRWMTGVDETDHTLTTKEFIDKFINTGNTMTTINVGDVYLNSMGKTCTIISLPTNDSPTKVFYRHQDGKVCTTGIGNIIKKWTKQTVKPIIANLQPGTKVRVRSDLRHDKDYCMSNSDELDFATKAMVRRASTIVTIDTLNNSGTYHIKEDSGCYNWTDEMFSEIIAAPEKQPIEDDLTQTTCKFKIGDTVRLKDGVCHGKKYNNTTFYSSHKFKGSAAVAEVCKSLTEVKVVGYYWYGVDALELVPQTYEQKGIAQTKANKDKKSKPVAQQEPIKPIKKEESFMSKLKATAITTIDQNKEAAIIAAKMEAGRVINKQVIKHVAKHVPFWAKGYLDTPLAPVVLANAVAMLGNHTNNAKVQKVSELMLLAAADVTVQSFNLDKIIDDVLSGIKLPAGILDDIE